MFQCFGEARGWLLDISIVWGTHVTVGCSTSTARVQREHGHTMDVHFERRSVSPTTATNPPTLRMSDERKIPSDAKSIWFDWM